MVKRHHILLAVLLALFQLAGCASRTTGVRERDGATARALISESEQVLESYLADNSGKSLRKLLKNAKGMMIMPSAGTAGFMLSFGGGTGILMANTDEGWTGPVVMTRSSMGWGWQAGITTQSGIVLFMHDDDVRYVVETGCVLQGQSRLVLLTAHSEYGRSPEFQGAGDVYYFGKRSGVYAGVAFNTGGYIDRPALNEALSGVPGGEPKSVLYGIKARPEAGARLREMIGSATLKGVLETKKDETEVPSL